MTSTYLLGKQDLQERSVRLVRGLHAFVLLVIEAELLEALQ